MIPFHRLFILLCALWLGTGWGQSGYFHTVEKTANRLIVEWQSPALTWQTVSTVRERFSLPVLGELALTNEAGRPMLPIDVLLIPLPNLRSASFHILDSLVTETALPDPIALAVALDSSGAALPNPDFGRDPYPASWLQAETGAARERAFLRLALVPLRTRPDSRHAQQLRYLRLQIDCADRSPAPTTAGLQKSLTAWKPEKNKAVKMLTAAAGVYQVTGRDLQLAGARLSELASADLKLYHKGVEWPLQVSGDESGWLQEQDQIRFYAERRRGDGEYYDAYSDTNAYWLTWSPGAGQRYRSAQADTSDRVVDHLPRTLHLEQDLVYYNGDSDADIQKTETVAGEGWVWYTIPRGSSFSFNFTLPALYDNQDSIGVRLRLRGTTLDPRNPNHHVQIYINQKLVHDFTFSDREQVEPVFRIPRSLLKPADNTLEIRSLTDLASQLSQFNLQWVEFTFIERCTAAQGLYGIADTMPSSEEALFVDGFAAGAITVWDVGQAVQWASLRTGPFYRANLQVRSAGLTDGNWALFYLNGEELYRGGRGHNVVTLSGTSGAVLVKRNFDTWGSAAQADSLAAFINRQANGTIILLAIADDGAINLNNNAHQALERLGATKSRVLKFRDNYALIGRAGSPHEIVEAYSLQGQGGVTALRTMTLASSGARFGVQFSLPAAATGPLLVFDSTACRSPERMSLYRGEDLSDPINGADYIIITHAEFAAAAQQLAAYRQHHNGYRARVVLIDDIYDTFAYGLSGPAAIREFLSFAYASWSKPAPTYVLILGDASWDPKRHISNAVQKEFVPSYGNPVSDTWFVCFDGPRDVLPEMAIGRLPVETAEQALAAVEKIIEYESTPSASWKKEFLFISGGFDFLEQSGFRSQSNALDREFIAPAPVHGHSRLIQKTTIGFKEGENRNEIMQAINDGALWVNFIGHAGSRTWDLMFHNADIDLLENGPLYPFITSMTCHTGRFAEPSQVSFGENFVLAPDRGAVAFMGTSGWGYSYEDYYLLRKLYPTVTRDTLRIIGQAIDQAKFKLWQLYGTSQNVINMLRQYNLMGDPALTLMLATKPDLAIMPDDIRATPETLSEADSAATLGIKLRNYGLATQDSVDVVIYSRHATWGQSVIQRLRRPPFGYQDSLVVTWPLRRMTGTVDIQVVVDPDHRIGEADEANNTQERRFTVLSNRIVLISPPPHAMVPSKAAVIKIQNPQVSQGVRPVFEFMVDTTATLNSAAAQRSGPITGDILTTSWRPSGLLPDRLYFWSVRNPAAGDEPQTLAGQFFSSSEEAFGWWSDFHDLDAAAELDGLEQTGASVRLHLRRRPIVVQSAGLLAGHYAIIDMDGDPLLATGRGYNLVVLDRKLGRVLQTGHFDTYGDATAADRMAAVIEPLDSNQLVLAAVSDEGSVNMNERAFKAFESLGSRWCRQIKFRDSWAFIGFKGAAGGQVKEQYTPAGIYEAVVLDTLTLYDEQGAITSPAIGPARKWLKLKCNADVADSTWLQLALWGKNRLTGEIDTLLTTADWQNGIDLTGISGSRYPQVRLTARLGTLDGLRSPVLSSWQIQYLATPDLALAPAVFSQSRDSVVVGEAVQLIVPVHNLGIEQADSVLVYFQEVDPVSGRSLFAQHKRERPLAADSVWMLHDSWTSRKSGQRQLLISVDPLDVVNEVNESNNSITATVWVQADTMRPQIATLYDDREIVPGDLVAGTPRVLIKVMDNSPRQWPDTSQVILWLDGRRVVYKGNASLQSVPDGAAHVAQAWEFKPTLGSGEHVLEIWATDLYGNRTIKRDEFSVTAELKILALLNYPNPFSQETDITFTLSQPAEVAIKIYTVAGRLIREIPAGAMAAGFNAVHWDGLDADGDALANGVYLYKVTAQGDGEAISEIGKAVVMQ